MTVHRANEVRHRWMVMMPFEVASSDARKMVSGELPTLGQVSDTELARGEAPALDDSRPWFGLHNVVRELVAGPFCYVCEQLYSDKIEAQPCPGDPSGADLKMPESPISPQLANSLGSIGRNDPCPCGSGRKFKKCHGA